jgi:hypothetical protein
MKIERQYVGTEKKGERERGWEGEERDVVQDRVPIASLFFHIMV